ncbi:MAG: methyl-accepting chemotaxis protein [Leptospiraceae bacterium]|nr:methyl-accepting chemotaxis protein [Leptospiraceae bacterium]MDW8306270.1 methyl-accepting chemotaxis protein [Leptospiraceae bacterium]
MENRGYVRKQILIDKSFQTKFIIKAMVPLIVFVLAITIGFFWGIYYLEQNLKFDNTSELIMKISEGLGTDYSSEKLFSSLRNFGLLFIFALALLIGLYLSYILLFFSHRIAGPIYRFDKTLGEILNGNLTVEVKLRAGDEFHKTAAQFNEMTKALRDRVRRIDQLSQHCQSQVKDMLTSAENTETRAKLEKTLDLIQGIREALGQFQI